MTSFFTSPLTTAFDDTVKGMLAERKAKISSALVAFAKLCENRIHETTLAALGKGESVIDFEVLCSDYKELSELTLVGIAPITLELRSRGFDVTELREHKVCTLNSDLWSEVVEPCVGLKIVREW